MSTLASVLSGEIRRLSRREIKSQTGVTRRMTTQHRRDIAALKRQITAMQKTVDFLASQEKRRVGDTAATPAPEGPVRFRVDGLRTHRRKLGLSAEDYGRLVGVSGQSVYHWEMRKARPRQEQIARLVAIRGIGKREALKRLELLAGEK